MVQTPGIPLNNPIVVLYIIPCVKEVLRRKSRRFCANLASLLRVSEGLSKRAGRKVWSQGHLVSGFIMRKAGFLHGLQEL